MTGSNETLDYFGDLLHFFRKKAGLTQQQLADAIGMHRHEISRWERKEVLPASKAIVLELAQHLHLGSQEARRLLDTSLTAPVPLWGVPFPRNPCFTGREDILEALYRTLRQEQIDKSLRVFAICGLGGMGKTQTALEYAYRHALEYRGIFWIEGETFEQIQLSLLRIAEILDLPERDSQEQSQMGEAVKRWFTTHDQWLLIWDNLVDLELPFRLLPPARQGAHLLTTCRQALGMLAHGIDLAPLGQEEALLLLLRRAKILTADATREQIKGLEMSRPLEWAAAMKLVEFLGGLPLALDQAGAYLEETGCSFTDYVRRYEQQGLFLLARRGGFRDIHPQSVVATINLSHKRVEQEQQGAADLLRLCAFLHPEAIPEDLFRAGALYLGPTLFSIGDDPLQFDQKLVALRNLSLVRRHAKEHTISLHKLVQAVLREQMDPSEKRLWSERVVRMVNAAFPDGNNVATWDRCEQYLAQALACVPLIAVIGPDLPEAGEILFKLGTYLMKRGRFAEAEPLLGQAVDVEEQQHGSDCQELIP